MVVETNHVLWRTMVAFANLLRSEAGNMKSLPGLPAFAPILRTHPVWLMLFCVKQLLSWRHGAETTPDVHS